MKKVKCDRNWIVMLCVLLLYGFNRFFLKDTVDVPIVTYLLKSHFNDWLGGIFVIAYINGILNVSRYKKYQVTTLNMAVLITIVCGIVWECVIPYFFHHGVSDLYDVIAYVIGGVTYIFLYHMRIIKNNPS